jgi:hypothetical protein
MQLLQAGSVPDTWAPYANKDEALSYLNNTVGVLTLPKNAVEALPYFLKTGQLEGKLKKQSITYVYIAEAYQSGPYEKMSAQYTTLYQGKDESPESKLALENINQVVDRMIDAYARAVSLAATEPANPARQKAWMDALTTWYKYRHNQSDVGLTDLIASVMTKPLPPQPTPLTTLPAAPPTTSTPTSGSNPAGSTAVTGTAVQTTNKPSGAAPTTSPKSAAETANTKTAVKPKIRNNHRRP